MTSKRSAKSGKKDAIRKHYEPRIAPGKPSHEILDWASSQSQQARFEILAKSVPLAGKSLLDVGCGLGDLYGYLVARGISVDYTGVDIIEKMVDAARHAQPGAKFVHADIFTANPFEPRSFDVVFCSGAFNLNLGNNEKFVERAIETFRTLSRQYVVFNMLHHRSAAAGEKTYFYYDPEKVRELLRPVACKVRIIDDYLHNDFTVICEQKVGG